MALHYWNIQEYDCIFERLDMVDENTEKFIFKIM